MLETTPDREQTLVQRRPEPELMELPSQVAAYAQADFSAANEAFIDRFLENFGVPPRGRTIDLGCGPGELTAAWLRRHPSLSIDAVDGSQAMIDYAKEVHPQERVRWHCAYLPLNRTQAGLSGTFETIISNSLLHHLPDPRVLWEQIAALSTSGTKVFIGDLCRPNTVPDARAIVEEHAATASSILKEDFFHSLCAAYRTEEIAEQLRSNSLPWLSVKQVSDRHILVWGVRP